MRNTYSSSVTRTGLGFRALIIAFAGVCALAAPVAAAFARVANVANNSLSTATLIAPIALSATAACSGPLPRIDLSWTASPSTFADGNDVYRAISDGGPYALLANVSGEVTSWSDSSVAAGFTYYYVVQASSYDWTSENSLQVARTAPSCT